MTWFDWTLAETILDTRKRNVYDMTEQVMKSETVWASKAVMYVYSSLFEEEIN